MRASCVSCASLLSGDINFKDPMRLVECEPDVRRVRLQPSDEFVVMASDGLWDVMGDQEACRVVIDELQGATTSTAGEWLLCWTG